MPDAHDHNSGKVYLVGAGPGNSGLMTLRGAACLAQAQLVLYDYLVDPALLDLVPAGAQTVCLGRHGQGRLISQDEINQQMIEAARAGRIVVRLKSGDPLIFARATEELDALVAADVAFEVVPGITAAGAAGAYAGIPLTHRELSSAVAFVTAHEDNTKLQSSIDYAALARFPGTLVFYMGLTTAPHWTAQLIAAGLPASTPAAIVWRCGWPAQRRLDCTLGTVAATIEAQRLRPPVIVIVGAVAALNIGAEWFAARPLTGQRVLVSRPRGQAAAMRQQLSDLGAEVLVQPAIEINPPTDWTAVDAVLERLPTFDWLVFSSANGVEHFLERLLAVGHDLRRLGLLRLAAIGPGTSDALARYRLRVDLAPDEFRAEGLAAALAPRARGIQVLLVRASRGREVLAESLREAGASVEQVVAYESSDVTHADPEVARALADGRVDWVTVTSSAIARSLVALFGEDLRRARLATISPVTSETLRQLGHEPGVEATTYTTAGVIEAIVQAVAARSA